MASPPHSPSAPRLLQFATEWNVLQKKKIGSFLLLLLLLSALFLLSILYSSSTLTVRTALSSPQKPSPESNAAAYETVHQSNSSAAPVTETTSQSPVSDASKCHHICSESIIYLTLRFAEMVQFLWVQWRINVRCLGGIGWRNREGRFIPTRRARPYRILRTA